MRATATTAQDMPYTTMTALARTQRNRLVWLPGDTDTAHSTPFECCPALPLCRARAHASAHARDALWALCRARGIDWPDWKSPIA